MSDITKITEQIIKELEKDEWARVDRLQKALEQLVKIEVAKIEAGKL